MEFVRPFEGKVEKALEYINDGGPVDSNLLFQSMYVQDFEVCTVLMGDGKDAITDIVPTDSAIEFKKLKEKGTVAWCHKKNQYMVNTDCWEKLPLCHPDVAKKYLGRPLFIPLHEVVQTNESKAQKVSGFIHFLVEHRNVDPNIVEPYFNNTALHWAILYNSPTIVSYLLKYNVLPSLIIKNANGKSPLDLAAKNIEIKPLISEYLKEHQLKMIE